MSIADNPYQASSATLVENASGWDIRSAGKWRRFFNWLIDTIAIYGSFAAIGVLAVILGFDQVVTWAGNINPITDFLLTAAVRIIYYSLFEGLFGFSIGKLITNTRVVDARGNKVSFGAAVLRSLCRHIPFEPFSLLFSDSEVKRGWHDSLPKTYVVVRGTRGTNLWANRISDQFAGGVVVPGQKAPAATDTPLPD